MIFTSIASRTINKQPTSNQRTKRTKINKQPTSKSTSKKAMKHKEIQTVMKMKAN